MRSWLSKKHLLAYAVYIPVAILALGWAFSQSFSLTTLIAAVGGWVFWTWVEYLLHRWAFHERPGAPIAKKYDVHWSHHRHPTDPDGIATSLLFTLPIAGLFWGLFWLISQGAPWGMAAYGGFGIGYLWYETLHALIHARPAAPLPFLRHLWQHHLLHHYKKPSRYYGVTVRWWDYLFGTA